MGLTSLWTKVPNGLMHARANVRWQYKESPIVVLVPGLVIASRYMVPTALELAPVCRVYAVDLPGYGKSAKPSTVLGISELADALSMWMEAVGLVKAHLVANSFGCQILAEFALRHPDQIDRLVLQGPTIDRAARSLWRQICRLVRNSARESPGLGRIMLQDYASAGVRRIRATISMALEDRIEEKLPQIKAPTLVVRGEKDPLVPQPWAEEVTRLLPRGELKVLPKVGHTIDYTAPREFVAVMNPFLHL